MKKEDTIIYLRMLGEELQRQDVTGEILVLDDIVVFLDIKKPRIHRDTQAYFAGNDSAIQIPRDINAYFGKHGATTREAISTIANREELSNDWLDCGIKDLFCTSSLKTAIEFPGIRVYIPMMQYALAMSVATADPVQDIDVVKQLAEKLHVTTPHAMRSCVIQYITKELFTSDMQLIIDACFQGAMRPVERRIKKKEKVSNSTDD